MEPITATLTGLALARQGISFIKDNLDSVQDAAAIGQQISAIFQGHDEFNKKRYEQPAFSLSIVAEELIEYKLQQEELYELKRLVNHRFGLGFWESIVAERAKRIEEHKELEKEQARIKRQKRQALIDTAQTIGIAIAIVGVLVVGVMIWFTLPAR